jgi:hypothetical protein
MRCASAARTKFFIDNFPDMATPSEPLLLLARQGRDDQERQRPSGQAVKSRGGVVKKIFSAARALMLSRARRSAIKSDRGTTPVTDIITHGEPDAVTDIVALCESNPVPHSVVGIAVTDHDALDSTARSMPEAVRDAAPNIDANAVANRVPDYITHHPTSVELCLLSDAEVQVRLLHQHSLSQ